MNDQTILLNFRTPKLLKQQFEQFCNRRNISMTSRLNALMADYVRQEQESRRMDLEYHDERTLPLGFYSSNEAFSGNLQDFIFPEGD